MFGLLEQAATNEKDVDVDELNNLADFVFEHKEEMLRDEVRYRLDQYSVDLANLVLNLPEDDLIVNETLLALEPSLTGLVGKEELLENLEKVAIKFNILPVSKLTSILDNDFFETDLAYASGFVERNKIRKGLKAKIPEFENAIKGMGLPRYDLTHTDRVIMYVEVIPRGLITGPELSRALSVISGKPEKYWKLRLLKNKAMARRKEITREKIRLALEEDWYDLDILVCDPMKQHPIIAEILKDLEGNYSGLIIESKLKKSI